jgi:hypothetical protein
LKDGAIFWLACPKLTSSIAGGLSRNVIASWAPTHWRETVTQIAVDSDWSALRFKPIH